MYYFITRVKLWLIPAITIMLLQGCILNRLHSSTAPEPPEDSSSTVPEPQPESSSTVPEPQPESCPCDVESKSDDVQSKSRTSEIESNTIESNTDSSHVIKEIELTVQPGETLADIANLYAVDIKTIADFNGLSSPYTLSPGQRLQIPVSISSPLIQTSSSDNIVVDIPPQSRSYQPTLNQTDITHSNGDYHKVQPGETLFGIAKRYGQNYHQVAVWNNISSPYLLETGVLLRITPPKVSEHSTPVESVVTTPADSLTKSNTVYHIVQPGDTLFSIAQRYGYTVAEIAGWNRLEPPYQILRGQNLQVAPLSTNQPCPQNVQKNLKTQPFTDSSINYHTVARGDTLYSISKRYGCSVAEIAAWNNLHSPYNLLVGEQLQVSATITGTRHTTRRYHTVKSGDTLKNIAVKYGVSVYELSKWNGIGSPYTIYPKQKLSLVP